MDFVTHFWPWTSVPPPDYEKPPSTERMPDLNRKLPPMKCQRCDFINEYVGQEHLDKNGLYTCRLCKQDPYR